MVEFIVIRSVHEGTRGGVGVPVGEDGGSDSFTRGVTHGP